MSFCDIKKTLYSQEALKDRVSELAKMIDSEYAGKSLVLVGILKGAYVFLSDLSRQLTIPHSIDFMSVSSYVDTKSTGTVKILTDLRNSVQDCHVIIVEDIVDSGLTLSYLIDIISSKGAATVESCVLLSKPTEMKKSVDVKYLGYAMNPPEFVVGYGLDYNEMFRNLPFIGVPTEEAVKKYSQNK